MEQIIREVVKIGGIMKVKRYIVTPDKHFPMADMKAIGVVCKAIEIIQPDGYIDLGDTGEWESVSHWQWKKKKRPPLEYQLPFVTKEIEEVNKGMDIIDESLDKANVKERHFVEGNHEDWLNRFVEENPILLRIFWLKMLLNLEIVIINIIDWARCLKLESSTFIMDTISLVLIILVIISFVLVAILCMDIITIYNNLQSLTLME